MSIGVLVDSFKYARDNCFIHQLVKSLKIADSNIKIYDWGMISRFALYERNQQKLIQQHDHVIVVCRQRVIYQDLPRLTKFLGAVPIVLYDQDPWNVYWDEYHTKGLYNSIINSFNLVKIAVPSYYWSTYIARNESVNTEFVRMGMLPEYCKSGLPYEDRIKGLSFKGSVHEHRLSVFQKIQSFGIEVKVETGNLSYKNFLRYLDSVSIFTHDESAPLLCNGEPVPRNNGMWHKDIEVASRGCFILRDYSDESKAYDIQSIPTIFMYKDINEIPDLVAKIQKFSLSEARDLQLDAIQQIKQRDDWLNTAKSLIYL
jgi:hypothetical protein